jgi:hypothetical protein
MGEAVTPGVRIRGLGETRPLQTRPDQTRVTDGNRTSTQNCFDGFEMEGGAMSAKHTQVDSTGNHSRVLDAQSRVVEWAPSAISCCHPSLIHATSFGAAPSCICYNAKDGSARRQSTKFFVQKGSSKEATPATQTQPQAKRKRPGSTRICAHAAQQFPLATRGRRTSRAHQGIEAVAAVASSLMSTAPILCAMQNAQRPMSHRKLRRRPLWDGAAACRGVQCVGMRETNRRRTISHR